MALLVKFYFQFPPGKRWVSSRKEGIFGKIGMSGIQIQVHQMIVVLHQGEPCTYRWTYLWQEEEDGLVPPVLDSLDNYKILSERMNVLTIYLPFRNWSSVLTSAQPESAVFNLFFFHTYSLLFFLVPISLGSYEYLF